MAEIEKARLIVQNQKKTEIDCMFNPETITIHRNNDWDGAGAGAGGKGKANSSAKTLRQLTYTGPQHGTFALELWFDTTHDGSPVTKLTGELLKLMEVDKNLPGSNEGANNLRPPAVVFQWGKKFKSWPSVITNLTIQFTYFSSEGVPLRAKADLTLMQFKEEKAFGAQNPTSGTPRPHRVHRVQPGETLDRISAHYYGDATRWRQLAIANRVEDPLTIRPGSLLSVPQLDGP